MGAQFIQNTSNGFDLVYLIGGRHFKAIGAFCCSAINCRAFERQSLNLAISFFALDFFISCNLLSLAMVYVAIVLCTVV